MLCKLFTVKMEKPNPLRNWIVQQQDFYGITGEQMAEFIGIAPQTWSKYRRGKSDMTGTLLWEAIRAIAFFAPSSDARKLINLVEGRGVPALKSVGEQLNYLIETADDEELNEALLKIGEVWAKRREILSKRTDASSDLIGVV